MFFPKYHTYLDIYVALRENNDNMRDYNYLFDVIKDNSCVQLSDSSEIILKDWCRRFCYRTYAKWTQSGRNADSGRNMRRGCKLQFSGRNC